MNSRYLAFLNDENGSTPVYIAKQHIVGVAVRSQVRYASEVASVEISCVNGHWYRQTLPSLEDARGMLETIMAELEDFT